MLVCLIGVLKLTFLKVFNMSDKSNKDVGKPKKKKLRCLYDLFVNSRVVVVLRNGVIIEGIFKRSSEYEIFLNDAIVKGSKYIAKVDKIAISKAGINLVHSIPYELSEKTENDDDFTDNDKR